MHGFWREIPTKLSVPGYTLCFGRTGCNNFTMPKAKTNKGSKKRGGGSNGNLKRRIRERNHAFGNESIRVWPPFIISSCTVCISWLSECQQSACGTLARQSARESTKRQKQYCTSFHSVRRQGSVVLGVFWIFHKWGQINNHGESCIMTWLLGAVKRWDICCENWSSKVNWAQRSVYDSKLFRKHNSAYFGI